MSVMSVYVQMKENIARRIADKTAELYMNGLSYEEALMKAKELYGEEKRDEDKEDIKEK